MFTLLTQSTWADRTGWVLVHSLWQFALLALVAIELHRALRPFSARARYAALLAAMVLMVMAPAATWLCLSSADAPAVTARFDSAENPENVLPSRQESRTTAIAALPAASPLEYEAKPQAASPRAERTAMDPVSWWSVVKNRVQPWLPAIVLLWFAGVLVLALRPLLSWHTVRRLRKRGVSPVPAAVQSVLERMALRLGVASAVEALQSTLVHAPVVLGYFRPLILLPACVATGLPAAQLESILAHELAHIRRHDYLVNLLQTLVETLFFYHPAVWWLSRQIRNERENCCDDVALAAVGNRADYGRALLAIEELRSTSTALSLAARGGSLLARMRRIAGCEPAPRIAGGGLMCVILVSIAVFAAVTWGAPAAKQSEQTPAAAETVVAGRVADAAGKAIADAQVAVVGRSRSPAADSLLTDQLRLLGSTKTDGEGHFRLKTPKLSSAAYYDGTEVVAVAPGFNLGWQAIGEDVENPRVTVSLTAEQTIHGRVLDASGKPAAGAAVHVTGVGKGLPRREFDVIQCWTPPSQLPFWPRPVTTDREGRFTLRGVDRSQILNVQMRDSRFAIDWMQIGLRGSKDTHVTTSPAGEVILSPPPARIFEGRITYDDTHQPVAQARVKIGASVDPMTCIMNMAGRTDAEGRFRLNPYSGTIFYISVYPPDGKSYLSYHKEIKLSRGQQPPQVEIALPRGVLLRGKITEKSSGEPVAGAAIKYEEQSRRPYRRDRIPPDHSPPSVRGISRPDGTYQLAIPPGRGTLFVQGPLGDYIRQTINTWDYNNDRNWTISQRHYVSAYASLDVKPKQEPAELNFAIQRGRTARGSIVGPDNRPVGDALMLSRHFLRGDEHTWRGGHIGVKNGQFELHGLDPDASVPFYFLDPQHETGATVAISGKSADHGPLVIQLQPCGKAVARFVDGQGKPKVKYDPGLQILVSPGPFRGDRKRNKKDVSSDQDFVANFDRMHYWDNPVTDEEGRCAFPALIPGATYRIDLMNKLGDWDERDFSVESGETLRLPDIVVPEPEKKGGQGHSSVAPSAPRAKRKPETKPGQHTAASSQATDQGGGGFHLVRGRSIWIGSIGEPFDYDDYDKNFYMSWGAHTVVLPKAAEGFWDFYGNRTLPPGVGRMDVSDVHSTSGQPANIAIPKAIDLPAYQLLLQPSAQRTLNLSAEQRTKLQDISAKYWPERRHIAGKALDDTEATSQKELAVYSAKAGHGIVRSTPQDDRSNSPFSKEGVEKLERQWSSARKQIEEALTPTQLRTLKDLTFRTFAFGSGVIVEPEVLRRLGVVKKQQDDLRALDVQLQKEKERRLRSMTREKITKMLAVLTPRQQSQLRETQSPDKNPETDCSMYPYPGLPSHMPDTGAAEDLGFSPEQRERVRKIVSAHWTSLGALQQEEQKLPLGDEKAFKAISKKRRQEMANLRKQIEAALTPEQWASCKQMAFENLAIPGLRREAHMTQAPNEMGLSEQQFTALREIEAKYFDKPEQIYRELTNQALTAFTPAQQDKLRAEVDRRGW